MRSTIEIALLTLKRPLAEIWILRRLLVRAQKEVRNVLPETRGIEIHV